MKKLLALLLVLALLPALALAGENVRYQGTGSTDIRIERFPYYPCRMELTAQVPGLMRIEFTGGKMEWAFAFEAKEGDMHRMLTYDAAAYGSEDLTVLITTAGDWTLEITPLAETGSAVFSGRGIGISDLFWLTDPLPLTITYDASAHEREYFAVYLITATEEGFLQERLFAEPLSELKGSVDAVITPDADRPYFYGVESSPGTTWSITPKE